MFSARAEAMVAHVIVAAAFGVVGEGSCCVFDKYVFLGEA